jgi:hypothetical protein
MSRAALIGIVALLVAVPVVAVASGAADWLSSDTASAALFAEDVRLGPPGEDTDATEGGVAADLGVAGGPLDCPPTGPGPEDSELLFQRQDERFWVTGTLSSFNGATAVVSGPSGDITATLAPDFDLVGDLSPGAAVQMTGTVADDGSMTADEVRSVCAGAGVIDCAAEEDPHFQLRIEGNSFEVTGRLESLTNDRIRVLGPGLVVDIGRDSGTTIEGGLDAGDPVRVEGTVADAQQLRALTVALLCEQPVTATPSPASTPNAEPNEECNRGGGNGGSQRFEVDDGQVEIKRGTVSASSGDSITVETPTGPVTVVITEDTEVKGDLASAAEVNVKGDLQDDDSVLAREIEVLCPTGDESDRGNGGGDDDDDGGGGGGGEGGGGGDDDDEGGGDD